MEEIKKLVDELHKFQSEKDIENEIKTLFKISNLYYIEKDYDKSNRTLKQILNLQKNITKVNYYIAINYLNLNDLLEGQKYLKKEIQIDSNNVKAKILLEKLYVRSNIPIATILIFVLILICYFVIGNEFESILRYTISSYNFNIFTAVTSNFIHLNIYHLLLNVIMLLIFGIHLEKYIGSLKFALIFFLGGIIGNMIQSLLIPGSFILGASSAIFAIIGSVVMREPLMKINLLFIFRIPIILVFSIVFLLQELVNVFFTNLSLTNANIAHLFGFLTGMLITGLFFKDTIKTFYNWLAIAFGFWIFINSITKLSFINSQESILYMSFALIGLFIVIYSYVKLTYSDRNVIRGDKNEN